MQEQSFLSAFDRMPWRTFKNTAGTTAPAWGLLRVTGFEIVNGEIQFTIGQPNATWQTVYLVNGPEDVSANGIGLCTTLMHGGNLLVDLTSGTPAAGQTWGAKSGQFSAVKDATGFFVGGAHKGTTPRARVAAIQVQGSTTRLGKPDANIESGQTGTVSLWTGAAGSETDSGEDVTVYCRGAGVIKDQFVTVRIIDGKSYICELTNEQIGTPVSDIAKGGTGDVQILGTAVTVQATASGAKVSGGKLAILGSISVGVLWKWYVAPWE